MMIPAIYWHQITCYLGVNCTRPIQTLNTVIKNLKSIYQNELSMSKIQLNIFWKRWRAELVTNLWEYEKLYKPKNQAMPNKNDFVLVFDDKQPRQKWMLGRITELILSNDGQIRRAKVFLGKIRNIMKYSKPPCKQILCSENKFSGFFWRRIDEAVSKKMKQTLEKTKCSRLS